KDKILISFRDSIVTGTSSDLYLERLRTCLFSMLCLIKDDYQVEVVYQVAMDYDFCKLLYQELSGEFDITFNENQVTLETAGEVYEKGVCIITNRLHGALLGFEYNAL